MAVDWPQVFKSSLAENIPPFLSELVGGKDGFRDIANVFEKNESLRREALLTVDPEERQSRLESGLQAVVAGVLRLNPDQVDLDAPLNTLGLDSLMAIEIKNNIDASLGVSLPLVRFLDGPNIAQLAARVLEELALSESASKFDEVLEMVKQLSDEEARSMLADEKQMMETEGTR
jgi:acyl carrier protein